MASRDFEDIFVHQAWQHARAALEFAQDTVLVPADLSITFNDGRQMSIEAVPQLPASSFSSSETDGSEPTTAISDNEIDPDIIVDDEGLYWVSLAGLQAAISGSFNISLRYAYMLGRLDQKAQTEENNSERFVRVRELGHVASETESYHDRLSDSGNEIDLRAKRILAKARAKHGSLEAALRERR
jgi:hypothetical protein